MTRVVHQFTPRLEPGAVGAHTLAVQRTLRNAGIVSEIFAAEADPRWSGLCRPLGDYGTRVPAEPDHVVMYQYAIGSPVAEFVQQLPGALVVNSHNQTPPELLRSWDPAATLGVTWGIEQLQALAPVARLGVADSAFNADEMRGAGYANVTVVPVFTDTAPVIPDPAVMAAKPTQGARWLFVGRVSPNKMQHRIVQAFAWYRASYDPDAQLVIVGGGGDGRYGRAVRRYIRELALEDAVLVPGSITDSELAAYYASADVFVCLSEHEGFCVPLLEAMRAGLPIVAKATTVIPETVADAGVLLDTSRPSIVAAAVHRVVTDDALRAELITRGSARAQAFAAERLEVALLDALEPLFA
jgi:glycosyltransferase involved in cell wall biosynthesis